MRTAFHVATALLVVAMLPPGDALAQLAGPNDAGVTPGHIHLMVKDVEAQTRFWIEMMGGTAVQNGPLSLIQLPGIFIMLRKSDPAAPPPAPPDGSVVNHVGFTFRNLPEALARWKALGVKVDQTTNPNQGYVNAPDGVRVEFFGDPQLPVAMKLDHVHSYVVAAAIPKIQAWYAKVFGGEPGLRVRVSAPGWIVSDFLPGINISFSESPMPLAPTKGRVLDHIGFDVTDLDAFANRLAALGLAFDAPPRQIPNAKTRVAFLTDPWGTYIEVTEHLAPELR